MGEMMLDYARRRGIVGFVLNGAIRDADAFLEMNVPSFAVGVTHRGPYKNGPGEVNCPIAIGGMVIMPGDLVLGDADGVVVVPIDDVADVYEAVAKHARRDKADGRHQGRHAQADLVQRNARQDGLRIAVIGLPRYRPA